MQFSCRRRREHQYVPERYNMQTELTVDVKADGVNTFEFDLKSM